MKLKDRIQKLNAEQVRSVNKILELLYDLEDSTGYEDRPLSQARSLLQSELNNVEPCLWIVQYLDEEHNLEWQPIIARSSHEAVNLAIEEYAESVGIESLAEAHSYMENIEAYQMTKCGYYTITATKE